jgi:arylformamidase
MSRRNSPVMQAGGAMKPLALVAGSAELPLLRKQTRILRVTAPASDCR